MNKTGSSELNVDEIIARIKQEVKQDNFSGRDFKSASALVSGSDFVNPDLPGVDFADPDLSSTDSFGSYVSSQRSVYNAFRIVPGVSRVSDFLQFHGYDFINTAYSSILLRSPDARGADIYLEKLQKGELTKIDILGRLRYSPEGRQKKVHVKGLLFPFMFHTFFKIPVLGWGLRVVTGILNLPAVLKNIQKIEADTMAQKHLFSDIQAQIAALSAHVHKADRAAKTHKQELSAHKQEMAGLLKQIKENKAVVLDMQRRFRFFLEEAGKNPPGSLALEQLIEEEDHLYDAMYVSFENKFRGTREDIKKRVQVYLPYVEHAMETTKNALVLDLGCGRGEWLEVLENNEVPGKNKIKAMGLDLNRIMVAQCQEQGLDVIESDVIKYLRKLKKNSVSVITGFHIIEHLQFKTLITLLDESFRVLEPGGIVIFETPNPENILVGACYFYTDPSHVNPLVPSTIQFILEQRGFSNVEIMRLHKYSDYYKQITCNESINGTVNTVNKDKDEESFYKKHICNEMDFAVTGTRA